MPITMAIPVSETTVVTLACALARTLALAGPLTSACALAYSLPCIVAHAVSVLIDIEGGRAGRVVSDADSRTVDRTVCRT